MGGRFASCQRLRSHWMETEPDGFKITADAAFNRQSPKVLQTPPPHLHSHHSTAVPVPPSPQEDRTIEVLYVVCFARFDWFGVALRAAGTLVFSETISWEQ
jgi:hypothetical protein